MPVSQSVVAAIAQLLKAHDEVTKSTKEEDHFRTRPETPPDLRRKQAPRVQLDGNYRFPLARLWVVQSIWQFLAELSPPLLHAETWSASISSSL